MGGVIASLKRVLFVPDTHRPYHDKRAWALMLKAARLYRPDIIAPLGDFVDCASVSSHSKDLSRIKRFKAEIADAREGLDELEALGAKEYIYIEGNHEDRLPRYLQDRAPELTDVLDIRSLLGLGKKWKYVRYKDHTKVGLLHITHDTGKAGGTAHVQALNDFQDNVVIGHTHRMGVTYSGNAKGKPHVGAMFGWLGDVKQVDYMHRVKANRDWMLGFGIGYLEPSGVIHLQAVPIIDYRCVIEGELVRG